MADVAETAKGALSTTFNAVKKFAVPALALATVFSIVAISTGGLAAPLASGAGVSELASVPIEGLKESATHLSDFMTWGAEKLGGVAPAAT